MKLVFFGSSNFALPILEQLSARHQVLAVVATPDLPAGRHQELNPNPVSVLANQLGLKIFKPAAVRGNSELWEQLKLLNADVFVVSAYGMILPDEIIYLPKLKTLNTHPSLLPKYRGPSPIQSALRDGLSQTGTSVMVLDAKMDTGPILAQQDCAIEPGDNYLTLSDKLAKISADLLIKVLPDYESGRLVPSLQNDSEATYTKIISKDDGRVDWSLSATEIFNLFRAFTPWPGLWTVWQGKKIKVLDCQVGLSISDSHTPGVVLNNGVIACGHSSFLQIKTLQLEGKTPTEIKSFLNGYKSFVGARLG